MSYASKTITKLLLSIFLIIPSLSFSHKKCEQICNCAPKNTESVSKKTKRICDKKEKKLQRKNRKKKKKQARKNRKKKLRQKKSNDPSEKQEKKSKKISDLDYDGLKKEKDRLVVRGDLYMAIKYIERMIQKCTDLGKMSSIMLELADLLFQTKHMAKAERLYIEFLTMYPGDEKAEYASYRAIVCCSQQTTDYFRDQTKTKETIELAQEFISRKEVFTAYLNKVVTILQTCQNKLLESEINIFNFYLKQGNLLAAQTRLDNVQKKYVPILPNKEPLILQAACALAEKQQNPELLAQKQADLMARFPEYGENQKTLVAKGKTNKKERTAFVNKF